MCQAHKAVRTESSEVLQLYIKGNGLGSLPDCDLDERSGIEDSSIADASSLDDFNEIISHDYLLEFLSLQGLQSCKPARLLGTGATCRVELVHISLPEGGPAMPAARKTMPRSRDPHMRAKEDALFAREVEGLRAGLVCPFVVRLLGTATYGDRQELLMELAEGNTLEHELSDALSGIRGNLTQPLLSSGRLAEVAASVLAALASLHSSGFAHLDIKPANLLRTAEGRLMLGDAGCIQRVAPDGLLREPASGTPLFAAPETKRRGAFSTKADMYSVGVLLAVCAAWHRQTGRVLAFLRGDVTLPDFVPWELRDLVSRLVAADPEQRPTASEALAHPFLAGVNLAVLAPLRSTGTVPR